jgi:hypothetical protein
LLHACFSRHDRRTTEHYLLLEYRRKTKKDNHSDVAEEAQKGDSISMHALPDTKSAKSAATAPANAAPVAPAKPDRVAEALKGNEKLFSGKVGQGKCRIQAASLQHGQVTVLDLGGAQGV